MDEPNHIFAQQLKETCKLTNAGWAVWTEWDGESWVFHDRNGINKTKFRALQSFVSDEKISILIDSGFEKNRICSHKTGERKSDLGCQNVFFFPNPNMRALLIVGADVLEKTSQGFFNILVKGRIPNSKEEISVEMVLANIFDGTETGVSYDLPSVLNRVLKMLIRYIPCDIACIGLRYGDYLRIKSVFPVDPSIIGWQVSIDLGLLVEIFTEQTAVNISDARINHTCPILPDSRGNCGSWLGVPLIYGKRVIGVVGFLSEQTNAFSMQNTHQAVIVSAHIAPAIETAVALAEATIHLEKLALLNELASAASLGADVDDVASGVVQRLKRIFNTELVSILWLSSEGDTLKEFGDSYPSPSPLVISVQESLSGYVAETGLPFRVGDVTKAPRYLELIPDVRSELAVPLKYHGNVIGVLDLESRKPDAFSLKDEQLLVVMASQLAGLIENVRLNDETRRRARNLELIHQVVQEIVGMTNFSHIAQTTAELLAERFAFELALVNLVNDEGDHLVVEGVGSNVSSEITQGLKRPLDSGIAGKVCMDGKS